MVKNTQQSIPANRANIAYNRINFPKAADLTLLYQIKRNKKIKKLRS